MRWRIELLGGLSAVRDGRSLSWTGTQKSGSLLAYLAYYRDRPHPRQILIEVLWPGCAMDTGLHRLSNAIYSLRKMLEPEGAGRRDGEKAIEEASAALQPCRASSLPPGEPGTVFAAERSSVRLNPASVTTDLSEFEAAIAGATSSESGADRPRMLAHAVHLYRGPLLAGHFEDWIILEQQRRAEQYFWALCELIGHLEQEGDRQTALEYALRGVRMDPVREVVHRTLMRVYAASGRPGDAIRQYHELERRLRDELNASPGPLTQALFRQIERDADGVCGPAPASPSSPLTGTGPAGGAVPLNSDLYIAREADAAFSQALARHDSIVLVKGPHRVGKSSLLARGLDEARQAGDRVALTSLGALNASDLESVDALLRALAQELADELDLTVAPREVWDPDRGPNGNFRRYLCRHVLPAAGGPVVWGLDDVDRLSGCKFADEVFSLFRSWHEYRAFSPDEPWDRLTLAMAYATEAHLFIRDLNRSPFNVGTRITLDDFTLAQVRALNCRYGSPLDDGPELQAFYRLVGGHPYLVRRGLEALASRPMRIECFETRAADVAGVYGDHLGRLYALLTRDEMLCDAVRSLLAGQSCPTEESFLRLRSAGVVTGQSLDEAQFRCQLYVRFLGQRLP